MAQTTIKHSVSSPVGSHQDNAGPLSYLDKITQLTPRQQEVFDLLVSFTHSHGYPPTYQEIAELLGVSSPNAASEHIRALERKGLVNIARRVSRGITIVEAKEPILAVQLLYEMVGEQPGARGRAIEFLKLTGVLP